MSLDSWMDRVIRYGFYLLFVLVPLVLTPWNYELFEYNKMMAVYGLTAIIVGAWIIKMAKRGEFRIAKTPLDIPIALFVGSQFVSSLFSMDPHVSWFGYYSRFNGGMFSIISYTLLYYTFVSNFGLLTSTRSSSAKSEKLKVKNSKQKLVSTIYDLHSMIVTLLKVALTAASVVALYGVAERLGIDKSIWVQDVQNRVFSTLGQPNWLAAYLVALIPVAITLALLHAPNFESKEKQDPVKLLMHTLWAGITILLFVVLLLTRSRSGMLGLAVADVVFWGLLFHRFLTSDFKVPQHRMLVQAPIISSALILHVAFALIVFINGTHIPQLDSWVTLGGWSQRLSAVKTAEQPQAPLVGPLLETGGTESGTIRKYVWQGAINAWKSSLKTMFIGTGTETFAFAFYQYRPKEHNMTSEWDFLYNKAHNEYLNYLATTGIFGLGSYLFLLGSFIYWFGKVVWRSSQTIDDQRSTICAALFAGWLSILVTNFLGFSVVIIQVFLFLFPAMVFVLIDASREFYSRTLPSSAREPLLWTAAAGSALLLILLSRMWYADKLFARGYRLARGGYVTQAYEPLKKATDINGTEPLYFDELGSTLGTLAAALLEQKNASGAAALAERAIAASDTAIAISPNNVNFWRTRTRIYYNIAQLDPRVNALAIDAHERARELSPADPKILYNLAILYGRQGEAEKGVALLKEAKELKPNYRDAYFGLYVFYTEAKKPQEARAILEEYLKNVDPGDKDFKERLGQ